MVARPNLEGSDRRAPTNSLTLRLNCHRFHTKRRIFPRMVCRGSSGCTRWTSPTP